MKKFRFFLKPQLVIVNDDNRLGHTNNNFNFFGCVSIPPI